MTNINYEKLLLETGLAAAASSGNESYPNFGAMSHDFGGLNVVQQYESGKLKCSTRTVGYSTLHVSTTTKA